MRSSLLRLMYVAAFLLLLVCDSFASGTERTAPAGIPFEFRDGLLWVTVETPVRSFRFVLDSGAGATVLNLQTAASAGVKLGRWLPVFGVDARAGARYVENFAGKVGGMPLDGNILAMDLSGPSRCCFRTIDGLIGVDFFRNRIVEIDFKRQLIRLVERPQGGGESSLRIISRNGAFCVPIIVNGGKPSWVRLDTGCNTALQFVVSRRTAASWLRPSIGLAARDQSYARGDVELGGERLDGVKIGLHEREIFPGESGLLGTGILSRFKVTIDLKANRLFLDPAS